MIKPQHSIIAPASLLHVVKKNYPVIHASKCELLALGCNDNYLIYGQRKKYVLRVYRYNWWPQKDVDEELRMLEFYHQHKIAVCRPVRTLSKKRYVSIKAYEGVRYAALFDYIEGEPLGHTFGKYNRNMKMLGALVASVHSYGDKMQHQPERWTLNYDSMVQPFIKNMHEVIAHREKDMQFLEKLSANLQRVLSEDANSNLNVGICHGDLHVFNVMLKPDNTLSIFDFDWSGISWRAYDVATVWWSFYRHNKSETAWRSFLREYTKSGLLSKNEIELLPWFLVLRHFEYLNFQLSMRPHIGTAWLDDRYYDHNIDFMKLIVKRQKLKLTK